MLNVIILMGRATRDPELRHSAKDELPIANFDIAVDNLRKESDGSQSASFFRVTCFGKVAENVSSYVKKGSKVAIQGSILQRSYMTSSGEKRTTYDVVADSVEFLDPKPVADESDAVEEAPEEPVAKFDPYTGEPLEKKPVAKKKAVK